jgi:hypothetical protein
MSGVGSNLGPTHWSLRDDVRAAAHDVVTRFGGAWNTYVGHGNLSGHSEYQTFDVWADAGRGDPLAEEDGDPMVAWLLGQHVVTPLELVIWWGWWWRFDAGWYPYPGWGGPHGPGADSHIHVVVR